MDQTHWINRVREDFGDLVLDPPLPDRELFAKAQAAYQPLRSFGSSANVLLADLELLARQIWKGSGE
ncbi:hypothetical protein IWX75_002675 [Arthrobacter sp. CAN_A6]